MTEDEYSAADIRIVEGVEAVLRGPGMYFGVGLDSPRLPTRAFEQVVGWSLHPATRVAPVHALRVEAEILGDLAFRVVDDASEALGEDGTPRIGFGSLIGPDRWCCWAVSAVSARTVVEVWRDGRGLRQELAGGGPLAEPERFTPPPGAGTRMEFQLDEASLAPGAAITAALSSLDLHGSACEESAGPFRLLLRDLR
ncbi:hypothetical protein [Streptomyces sp. NBC_00582]|uniref:hypothetical protein n=1 Tax=Streptomyces sp. NBC_00582 TaxID=2975783 RepID=UPI001062F30E|nr:hypothetical protein [Streptomyces sp. NBC_00582]WUB65064.1 hypothetical protein OG852_34010 [Streptomyces sp. NBC_00582]